MKRLLVFIASTVTGLTSLFASAWIASTGGPPAFALSLFCAAFVCVAVIANLNDRPERTNP